MGKGTNRESARVWWRVIPLAFLLTWAGTSPVRGETGESPPAPSSSAGASPVTDAPSAARGLPAPAGSRELVQAIDEVLRLLPSALRSAEGLSEQSVKNVERALEQARQKAEAPSASPASGRLLEKIRFLTRKLSQDVLQDVHRTVEELNELSESIE